MGWKSLRFVVLPTSHVNARYIHAVIPASAVIAYLDQKTEALKQASSMADVPYVEPLAPTVFHPRIIYCPKTIRDWAALAGLCQALASRDTVIAAPIGREYVRIRIGNSIMRIRVSRTINPAEVHQKQQMYYVSYEGEYDSDARTINTDVPHDFTKNDAFFPPTYVDVANFLHGTPYPLAAEHMRGALQGQPQDSGNSELRTAVVAAFLAEGARNIRAIPINLMMLDLVQQAVPYTTSAGDPRFFEIDRMFWKRSERKGTAGGYIPQSGAKGADVKMLKSMAPPWTPGPIPQPEWNYRVGFQPHPASPDLLPPLMVPQFAPQPFQQSRSALNALAQNALDKECGAVCMWLSHKFYLRAVEQYPDADCDTRFPIIDNLNSLSQAALAADEEVAQGRGIMRSLETIRGALDDRLLGVTNLLEHRVNLV
jgi:hypothetical protein